MNTTTHLDTISVFIFIGVFQGFILSYFFIKKSSSSIKANLYQGLLLLSLTLCILEQFLNISGYITRILVITNFTEPLNLTIGPLLYLFIKKSIDPSHSKKDWIHFIPAFLYLCYLTFDLIQPNDFKYNTYLYSFHPDWPRIAVKTTIPNDPLNIKKWLNLATGIHLTIYTSVALRLLHIKGKLPGETIFNTSDEVLRSLRNMVYHISVIVLIFIIVKLTFKADLGDYYIGTYVSVFILITTFRVMNDSDYFNRSNSFLDLSIGKYQKSSLTESRKLKILENIILELENRQYFSDNLASLSELAKKIGESPHHVSQVMNEKLNKSFFELLAYYRIEEAKTIFSNDKKNKLTVEEISEMVGYNSKTAFNNAFKKLSGKTPTEFRKSLNS